jgi:NAD(P)H-quinone oxidoreductase subunit 5
VQHNLEYFLPLAAPLAYATLAFMLARSPGRWPLWQASLPILVAAASLALLVTSGSGQSPLLGIVGVGISVRLDPLSVTLLLLVSFLGLAVLHYSRQYLAGDPRHGVFMRDLALTLAAVTALVTAGNLYLMIAAWIAMSLLLNRLLLFRQERPAARLAARKKFILARVGDASLLVACGVLIAAFGTAEITSLSENIRVAGPAASTAIAVAAALLALTALLKSAQFPAHGWLIEVMETPTPVSALLHAGVVNAGGFLLLRFADLISAAPTVSLAVAGVGAITAIAGSTIMLTQNSIKSALAYSTVGQMGFMMLQCGLGAYSAAVVHLVGHSLYKAHAFLASGDAVRRISAEGWHKGTAAGSWLAGLARLAVLSVVYAAVAGLLGYRWESNATVLSLGLVLIMGLWLYLDAPAPGWRPRVQLAIRAAGVASAYFAIQYAAAAAFVGVLPAPPVTSIAHTAILVAMLVSCLTLTLLQGRNLQAPGWRRLRVHLSRGLYINVLVNRWLGAFSAAAHR